MTNTAVTYHCPNCSAGLSFSPDKQKFCCEYCLSEFTEQELSATETARAAEDAASEAAERAADESGIPDEEFCEQLGTYHCAACGADVVADDTTAATECPYCHNPVILAGRLSGQMKPHKIIPFRFDKEAAQKRFLEFAGKKKFVPRSFLSKKQLEHIAGIYYPFWVTDADTSAAMVARATRVRTWRQGDYRYTETSNFHVRREGEIHFEDIVTPALREEDRTMLDGILPYPSDSLQDFSMAYLSGFVAKKRDIEQAEVRDAVRARMTRYATTLLRNTIDGYATVTPQEPRMLTRSLHWEYTLMPIWLLNYHHKGKTYTYAMNGYTGKVYGELPVCAKRLSLLGAITGAVAGVLAALVRFFLL
ncbi:MAG: TFIIB-type zinc ribbon-containing protein [Ruminococcaceae bacterium]|nr:TFIIB-type zinc ribbon-containing protein [Oscillospiraceae bacterium]